LGLWVFGARGDLATAAARGLQSNATFQETVTASQSRVAALRFYFLYNTVAASSVLKTIKTSS
jgi:hypothetical protein